MAALLHQQCLHKDNSTSVKEAAIIHHIAGLALDLDAVGSLGYYFGHLELTCDPEVTVE